QAAEHLNADDVVVSVTIHNTGEPMRRMLLELKPLLPQGCTLHIEGKGAARIKRIPGVNRVAGLGAA
ncbi:MAG: hypothetical protein NTW40_02040, partial [Acidobacteria bacterium]|nr:hypothetical protein [Acidobacteriota bacterium]